MRDKFGVNETWSAEEPDTIDDYEEPTLDVVETVDTSNTITDSCKVQTCESVLFPNQQLSGDDVLNTRPVSWTSPEREAPEILDSRMEETSEAAVNDVE